MNIFKCPFCGKQPETHYYNEEEGHDEFWITGCPDCDLFSGITAASKEISQRDWNTLIAKFPPIMQVKVGDKIEYSGLGDNAGKLVIEKIKEVDFPYGVMRVESDFLIYPHAVKRWPWELE